MKLFLEFTVFIAGAALMILELCGSRILAPYVGASVNVWASLIGIILGSLSVGYFFGGRMADGKHAKRTLYVMTLLSSLLVGFILIARTLVLQFVDTFNLDVGIKALIAALILFAPPSFTLGSVTPLATKLKIENVKTAGGTIGSLYAISTIGSIFGTFLTGFILLAYFSVTQILIGIAIVLFWLFLLLTQVSKGKRIMSVVAAEMLVGVAVVITPSAGQIYESRYNHVEVFSSSNVKILKIDNKLHSGMFLKHEGLAFENTKYFMLAKSLNPSLKKILMIGGGAYSVPKEYLRLYKDVSIDVVEIDPLLTKLAFQEFSLKKDKRLSIIHEDGRTFLNREVKLGTQKYDAILMDAFNGYVAPFQLSTNEAIKKMSRLLNDNGIVISNTISAFTGRDSGFLRAEYSTYKNTFPYVFLVPVRKETKKNQPQNIFIIASKKRIDVHPENIGLNKLVSIQIPPVPILTDDFAPVEKYAQNYN